MRCRTTRDHGAISPPAQKWAAPARVPQRDARPPHEAEHGLRRLPGQQLDVVQADAAAPVQVLDQRRGERHRSGEPVADRTARRHARDAVRGQGLVDHPVAVERADELDLAGIRHGDRAAGADGHAERMRAAQHGVRRHAQPLADFGRCHPQPGIEEIEDVGRDGVAIFAIPAAAGAGGDAVHTQPVADRPLGHAEHRGDLT